MASKLHALAAAALIVLIGAAPAQADDVEDALEMALEAYRAGDLAIAKEEIDFAAQLIAQKKAAALSDYLPQPLPGWERIDDQGGGQAGMFGGGMSAAATYTRENERVEVQFMANNQMVTAMAGMFGNAAMMGSMGEVKRINRQKVVLTQAGEVQTLVDNRIFITISGNAPAGDKEAYFEAIDLRALEDF